MTGRVSAEQHDGFAGTGLWPATSQRTGQPSSPAHIRILALAPASETGYREIPLTALRQAVADQEIVWVDIAYPDASVAALLGNTLGLEPQTVENCLLPIRMPKFDPLANDGAFIAAFAIRLDPGRSPRLQATAVALVVGPTYLISLHRESVPELTTQFEAMLGSESERLADSGPGLAHAVLDAIIDRHLPVMLEAAEAAEELEDQLDPQAERRGLSALEHLIVLRRDLLAFRRLAVAQQEVLRRVGRTFPEAHAAFLDVADNQREAIDTGAATCDYIDGAIEAYRVRRDAQTEEGVRWLTILAGILGPLSVLIGFWQLNFPNIPGSGWSWGWPVFVGLQLCFIALSLWYFRRRGML